MKLVPMVVVMVSSHPKDHRFHFVVLFKTGAFFESKIVRSFFVNRAEQLESQSWPMDNKLALFKLGKTCPSVAVCGSTGIGRCRMS